VQRIIEQEGVCVDSGGVRGATECKPLRGGWQCEFGVTAESFTATMFVPPDGKHVEFTSIC